MANTKSNFGDGIAENSDCLKPAKATTDQKEIQFKQ